MFVNSPQEIGYWAYVFGWFTSDTSVDNTVANMRREADKLDPTETVYHLAYGMLQITYAITCLRWGLAVCCAVVRCFSHAVLFSIPFQNSIARLSTFIRISTALSHTHTRPYGLRMFTRNWRTVIVEPVDTHALLARHLYSRLVVAQDLSPSANAYV